VVVALDLPEGLVVVAGFSAGLKPGLERGYHWTDVPLVARRWSFDRAEVSTSV
jgi:hypothetical protein